MKKLLLSWATIMVGLLPFCGADAQTLYGNEWIDYNASYYKIKVAQPGLYQIPFAVLQSAGMNSVNGSQLIMFRNGVEVPIQVTTNTALSSADTVTFYGMPNDGSLDSNLYKGSANQANPYISLYGDTAVYFLTYNNNSGHLRYSAAANNIPVSPGPPLAWAYTQVQENFKSQFFVGNTAFADGVHFYNTSVYNKGEGFGDAMHNNVSLPYSFNATTTGLVDTASGNTSVELSVVAQSLNASHYGKLSINGNAVDSSYYGVNDFKKFQINLPSSSLTNSTQLTLSHIPQGSSSVDFTGCAYYKISYPRNFNMNNSSAYRFQLSPNSNSTYLEFTNFTHSGARPLLYDLTNNLYYEGDTATTGVVKFYINPLILTSEFYLLAPSQIQTITSASPKTFINYTQATHTGNYLILTPQLLMGTHNSRNVIDEYKTYRASTAGGGYDVEVVPVEDLYDQFAYGIQFHPLSIKNFLRFAENTWATNPEYVLLLGKGLLYREMPAYWASGQSLPIMPTYGDPGSDNLFTHVNADLKMKMAIGRLSVRNTLELANYFDKLVLLEAAIADTTGTPDAQLWKKKIVGISGGLDPNQQQNIFLPALNTVNNIVENAPMGAQMTVAGKNSVVKVTDITSNTVDSLIASGVHSINYFGHGGTGGFEYALRPANTIANNPRPPIFLAMACDVGRIFEYTLGQTFTETYMLAPNGGTSAFISSTNVTYTNFHPTFMAVFYNSISNTNYGEPLGKHIRVACDSFVSIFPPNSSNHAFYYGHITSHILQGDPALQMMHTTKRDFSIDSSSITINPQPANIAADSISVSYVPYNLGINQQWDSVKTLVQLILPNGSARTLQDFYLHHLRYNDTVHFKIGVDRLTMRGLNKIRVTLDADSSFIETNEDNNLAERQFFIHSDQLIPVLPKEFAIVHQQGVILKASTLDPMKVSGNYLMEIDTTRLFNSSTKLQTTINAQGGVITWQPSLTLEDSVVYYWRAARDSSIAGATQWSSSSFIYLPNANDGWNQSHYYQYLDNDFNKMTLNPNRQFEYAQTLGNIRLQNAMPALPAPLPNYTSSNIRTVINGVDRSRYQCAQTGTTNIMIMIVDTMSLMPWANTPTGRFGAAGTCNSGTRNSHSFQYNSSIKAGRDSARALLAMAPAGSLLIVRSADYGFTSFYGADVWKADTTINGTGQSLYHDLKNLGFSQIDSYNYKRNYYFVTIKGGGSPTFPTLQLFSKGIADSIDYTLDAPYADKNGSVESTIIGPATAWDSLKWSNYPAAANDTLDKSSVKVYGVRHNQPDTLLLVNINGDTSLTHISAATFNYLRLEWATGDSINRTPPQLNYWRVLFTPSPEAALTPNKYLVKQDTVQAAFPTTFSTAITNISSLNMDSLLVNFMIVDSNNLYTQLSTKKYAVLNAQDTLHADITFTSPSAIGNYNLFIEANPFNNQPEQYHPNNIGYIPFIVVDTVTLPTEGVSPLIVNYDGKCGAQITWTVNGSDENQLYELQRSVEGRNFVKIYEVAAGQQRYHFHDAELAKGDYLYRLTSKKKSGLQVFSAIVKFQNLCTGTRLFSLAPNPAEDQIQLQVDAITNSLQVFIINAIGQKVLEEKIGAIAGSRIQKTYSLSHLPRGNYLLYLIDGQQVKSIKFNKR